MNIKPATEHQLFKKFSSNISISEPGFDNLPKKYYCKDENIRSGMNEHKNMIEVK